ncbi:MAG: tyrosine-type recombinase/integrase [Bacteroidales bacterium]|nr:tyrosine-type recombinase/integrase [Bacteroidales bacterium]
MVEKAGRVLTDQEVSAIYEALPANARGPFVFALHTGVRRGELLALRWERVRKATEGYWEAEIGGIGGPKTKTGRSRVVPLHPAAVDAPWQAGGGACFDADEHLSVTVFASRQGGGAGAGSVPRPAPHMGHALHAGHGDLFGLMQLGGWSSLGA